MRASALFVVLSMGLCAPARADCRASASGAYSIEVSLSPRSGRACIDDVRVFEGRTCGPGEPRWAISVGCSEARRMVVSDRGRLVTLLAPRASRREWEIVRVFEHDGQGLIVRSVHLEELPGLPGSIRRARLSLDATELRVIAPPLAVPVSILETLGRASARRRAWL